MKKKIMIVDDEPDQLFTIKAILEDINDEYEVITADGGNQCLELLKINNIPDLILLDILMPEMNGWEVQKRIRQNLKWRNIPIIFLTAVNDKTSEITARNIAKEFIGKPIDVSDFKGRIEEVLKK
ncbi:response regulator containing a CheY-like receiver domain and an HD-GYP domain [Thermoplasmatales archaeon SCGC AB-540-F20]|nr:response regulator containing a CheY-like receiver domain and an HD-GYP domain [Thermoplasmatales archaeon SCGC AB-540-F20]